MQNLTRLISEAKSKNFQDQKLFNIIREYLQVLVLKAIYQSKYGRSLSFMGGTCLRICHNLKRYSEDLDFTCDRPVASYSFTALNEYIAGFLKHTDFEVDMNVQAEKTVQKSFIRIGRILHFFGLTSLKSQKLHVKLEIDLNPVRATDKEIETFFVTRFDENFPILKHTDGTLFAGKIYAVLNRRYAKGRDFYDLIWYMNRKTGINFRYLNEAFAQAGIKRQIKDAAAMMEVLQARILEVDTEEILRDIGRFLEDAGEEQWIMDYPTAFRRAAQSFLEVS